MRLMGSMAVGLTELDIEVLILVKNLLNLSNKDIDKVITIDNPSSTK
jgi:pseudouridine-5'-phosphate glycosidase